MPSKPTALSASGDLQNGKKLYQQRARKALPYLVRQAHAGKPIYYSALAKELGMPNPRNLNCVLGSIGNALKNLGNANKHEIPPIQCLVVNLKDNLPGDGIEGFIGSNFHSLSSEHKKRIVDKYLANIYSYPKWDALLQQLGLQPLPAFDLEEELNAAGGMGGSGESEEHRHFKEFLAEHPERLGLKKAKLDKTEFLLPSGDRLDILFHFGKQRVAVEVKSKASPPIDILRGFFQCVKYKPLVEAHQTLQNQLPNARVILALEGAVPEHLRGVQHMLGIEVIESIENDIEFKRKFSRSCDRSG